MEEVLLGVPQSKVGDLLLQAALSWGAANCGFHL